MITRTTALLAALLILCGVAVSCGDDGSMSADERSRDSSNAGETIISLEFEGGGLAGGVRREVVSLGDTVVVRVVGAFDEQIHVHGYDLHLDPGGEGVLQFEALIPGRFEIELESSGRVLIELTVS